MSFRLTGPFWSVALAALVASACSPSAPAPVASAAGPVPAPAVTSPAELISKIHHALLIPGSEVLYSAESAPPTVAAAWVAVQQGAAKVSQGADQLAQGRGVADSWTALSHQLAEAARASGAASAATDTDQLRLANEQLAAACTGCHQAYAAPKP